MYLREGGIAGITRTSDAVHRRRELADLAASVPIAVYADAVGVPLVKCGSGLRHAEMDSLHITDNKWKRWSGKTGAFGKYAAGSTIQFVQEMEGLTYSQAVDRLISIAYPNIDLESNIPVPKITVRVEPKQPEERVPLILPEKAADNQRVRTYLVQKRGLDPQVVQREFEANRLYQDKRGNCVFVGYRDNKEPAFACVRSTSDKWPIKMDIKGSRKAWSWRVEPARHAERLFIFESPIEALSYMSILKAEGKDWQRNMFLSLGGVGGAALFNCLDHWVGQKPDLYFCLNNDTAGLEGARALGKQISSRGLRAALVRPGKEGQDWNDVLRERVCLDRQIQAPETGISR